MTNNEAAKWIQLYIDLAKIDPFTGEERYLNDNDRKTIEAMEMAINALTAQSSSSCAHENDSISRQAAIREYQEVCKGIKCGECPFLIKVNTEKGSHLITDCKLEAFFHDLPSVQPDLSSYSDKLWRNAYERGRKDAVEEIIHCRDCRWRNDQTGSTAWLPCRAIVTPSDFYCGRAERRTDGCR